MRLLRKHLSTILVAVMAASAGGAAPAIAHGVDHALFAHDSDKLDGVSSNGFVRGNGATRDISIRVVRAMNTNTKILAIDGLGRLMGDCSGDQNAIVRWENTTGVNLHIWSDNEVSSSFDFKSIQKTPGQSADVAWFNVNDHGIEGGTFAVGSVATTGVQRMANLHVWPTRASVGSSCVFQVFGTHRTIGSPAD